MTDNEAGSVGTSADQQHLPAWNPPTAARPVLLINPPGDRAFTAAAEALLDDGLRSLSSFQGALRRSFPDAMVRARDLSGEADEVWYVFRDGHWVNGRDGNPPVSDGG